MNTTTLNLKIVNSDLLNIYDNKQFHEGDAGFDLYFPETIVIKPFEMKLIDLGIQCEMIRENKNTSYYMYPRSSISKTPLMMANSVGIIDAGYRGNIKAAVRSLTNEEYTIKKFTRLFQICAPDLQQFNIKFVNSLSETSRNNQGIGSTGN